MLRNGGQFLEGLVDGRRVYYRGELVSDVTRHFILQVPARHSALLFDLHFDPELQAELVTTDDTGESISTFYQSPTSTDDLLRRSRLIEATTHRSRGVFNIAKVIGSDALFALHIVTAALDRARGTDYRRRVLEYHRYVAHGDRAVSVAQTDVKGDRSLRPYQQADPDLYVRIRERRSDGIVVRGAKAHITQAQVADELIVIPCRSLSPEDADYAVAFAVPANAPGITMVTRPMVELESARHPLEGPRVRHNTLTEALVVLDDVFVPWERVFLAGETEYASRLALTFALWHRFSAISYRAAQADLMAALAREIAEANGIADKSHIRRNLVELILLAEVQRMAAHLAAYRCHADPTTGLVYPDPLSVNLGKLYSNTHYLSATQAFIDCAGGLVATAPSGDDWAHPDLRPIIEKYLTGRATVTGERRFRLFLLARELVGLLGGYENVTMVHAEGSIEASVIEILRGYDFSAGRRLIEALLKA